MKKERKLLPDEIQKLAKNLIVLMEMFIKADKEIYLIGGFVRDLLIDKPLGDCDLTTDAKPEETMEITQIFNPFYENEFGTVSVPTENKEVMEITTFRSEKDYSDFRRPDQVTWGKTLEEDVQRRDFTINTLAIKPVTDEKKKIISYVVIDLVNGMDDLEKGLVKAVGEANKRFGEDALRMMRAVRLATTLNFKIEKKTWEAIKLQSPLLKNISQERIKDELFKILASSDPSGGMRKLIESGLMEYIIPELKEAEGVEQKGHHVLDVLEHMIQSLEFCPSPDPLVRLAAFLHDIAKPRTKRWRCPKCDWIMKDKDLKEGRLTCPRCSYAMDTREATTFYGHEVIGARMVKEIAERLRLSKKQTEKLVTLVRWHMFAYQPEMTDAAIRRFIRRVGKKNISDMILLRIGDRKGGGSKATSWRLTELQKRVGEQLYEPMEIRDLVIKGTDVMKTLKIKPGPKIGEIMKQLFEEVIEDTSRNNKEYLLRRVEEMGKRIKKSPTQTN